MTARELNPLLGTHILPFVWHDLLILVQLGQAKRYMARLLRQSNNLQPHILTFFSISEFFRHHTFQNLLVENQKLPTISVETNITRWTYLMNFCRIPLAFLAFACTGGDAEGTGRFR